MSQPPIERQPPSVDSPAPEIRIDSLHVQSAEPRLPAAPRPSRSAITIAVVASLVALAALASTAWIYADTKREILRMSTDIAQIRISLDLYARNAGTRTGSAQGDQIADLSNRLAILEQNWREQSAAPSPAAAASTPSAATSPAAQGSDCLPSGMRILVAAGDTYPVCDKPAEIAVTSVDNGYIVLSDGTTVPSGGSMPLGTSGCMVGVTSGGDEGLTGYAEIRVTC